MLCIINKRFFESLYCFVSLDVTRDVSGESFLSPHQQGSGSQHHNWPCWMLLSNLKAAATCLDPDVSGGHLWGKSVWCLSHDQGESQTSRDPGWQHHPRKPSAALNYTFYQNYFQKFFLKIYNPKSKVTLPFFCLQENPSWLLIIMSMGQVVEKVGLYLDFRYNWEYGCKF